MPIAFYEDLPLYKATLSRLSEGLYGEAVGSVIAAIGPLSDEQAMKIVDAVLGPLRLVSPRPSFYNMCDHTRFTINGTWHSCTRDHGVDDGAEELHRDEESEEPEEWYEDDNDGRSFSPKAKGTRA